MTLPAAATKVNLDAATDDPSQARAELVALIDKFNALLTALPTDFATAAQGTKADAAQPAATAINTGNISSQSVALAAKTPFRGCIAKLAASQTLVSGTGQYLSFGTTIVDTSGIKTSATDFTVPSGVTKINITCAAVVLSGGSWEGVSMLILYKNGSSAGQVSDNQFKPTAGNYAPTHNISSGVLHVAAGDVFKVFVGQTNNSALSMTTGTGPYISIELCD